MIDIATGIEAVRPYISTGAIVALLAIASRLYLTNRKMSLDGYGPLIEALQNDAKNIRELLSACQEQHRSAARQADDLRKEVDGLKRAIAQNSQSTAFQIIARDDDNG